MSVRLRPPAPDDSIKKTNMNSNNNPISEKELEYIFSGEYRQRRRSRVLSVFFYTILTLAIFALVFVFINYQALYKKASYWYQSDYTNTNTNNSKVNINPVTQDNYQGLAAFSDNHIYIPKISVDAPITWMVQNTEEATSSALEKGAIHLLGTALPGKVGNVFITAHSSNYAWAPGQYKSLFALLNNLVVGDPVYLKYQNVAYLYKVNQKTVVKPDDISVLDQGNESKLTLMTCTPVGTTLNRLIITANQIYPDLTQNTPMKFNVENNSLPTIR